MRTSARVAAVGGAAAVVHLAFDAPTIAIPADVGLALALPTEAVLIWEVSARHDPFARGALACQLAVAAS